jgi:hypothetical protein
MQCILRATSLGAKQLEPRSIMYAAVPPLLYTTSRLSTRVTLPFTYNFKISNILYSLVIVYNEVYKNRSCWLGQYPIEEYLPLNFYVLISTVIVDCNATEVWERIYGLLASICHGNDMGLNYMKLSPSEDNL